MLRACPARVSLAFVAVLLSLSPALAEECTAFGLAAPTPRQDAVLYGVLSVTRQVRRQGGTPVSIFDLDATLFEAGCRHKAIFLEFARDNRDRYPRMEPEVAAWVPDALPYAVEELIRRAGVEGEPEVQRAFRFWKERFFSNEYVRHDHAVSGAVEFVKSLARAGSVIVYLTGREEASMQEGTLARLAGAGLPLGPGRGELMMAARSSIKDDEFKGSPLVKRRIASLGTIVAIFDNEPGNCNALQKSFPEALTVLLDTNHSPGAPPADPGIPSIGNFRWSAPPRPGE